MTQTPTPNEPDNPNRYIAVWEHLEELRFVIFKSLAVLSVGTCIGFAFTEFLYRFLQRPLAGIAHDVELVFAAPLDAFLIKIKLAFFAGAILAMPFVLALVWSFVAPALKQRERKAVWHGIGWGSLFFCAGVSFGFSLLPYGLNFLVSFGTPEIRQLWPMQVYFDFCFRLLLGFGIVFQLPVVLTILVHLEIVQVATLTKNRPYAMIAAFTVAAFLTPPDVVSQIVLALPLMLLYEASIVAGRIEEKRRRVPVTPENTTGT